MVFVVCWEFIFCTQVCKWLNEALKLVLPTYEIELYDIHRIYSLISHLLVMQNFQPKSMQNKRREK